MTAYLDRALLETETIERRPRFSSFAAYGAPLVEFLAISGAWTVVRTTLVGIAVPEDSEIAEPLMWLYVGGLVLMAVRFGWRMAARFLNLTFSEIAVTNLRYMEKTGVLDLRFWATELDKIQRVEIEQPLLGRLFDYGDVTIVTVGEVDHTTRAVAAPLALQQAIHTRMTRAEPRREPSAADPRLIDERAAQ